MFNKTDINRVKKARPDLSDQQCNDVLGFLCEVYDNEPYDHNEKVFESTAEYIFGEAK